MSCSAHKSAMGDIPSLESTKATCGQPLSLDEQKLEINQGKKVCTLSSDTLEKMKSHPCYSSEAQHKHARMHLPVAPQCNIGCNYCNRKYDCLHESRPGVTSEVLNPEAARQKYLTVKDKVENLSVVGIAGPGDALADWNNTKKTIQMIKECDPEVIFCLSTNGLLLPEYAAEIVAMGLNHVTVTVNTLNPETGARIYKYVNYHGKRYEGAEGAGILLKNQLEGIAYLAKNGVAVKVNIVMIQDINDREIPEVVKKVKELGAFITNIMPLIPASGSAFENYPQTSMTDVNDMRKVCQLDLQQMTHCRQCRADAIGLLGDDRSLEFRSQTKRLETPVTNTGKPEKTYRIAVATKHGRLVDQHFGHAKELLIYQGNEDKFQLIEKRSVAQYCTGAEECEPEESVKEKTINAIKDCDAVISLRIGYAAKQNLAQNNIVSVEYYDTVENGLKYAAQSLKAV